MHKCCKILTVQQFIFCFSILLILISNNYSFKKYVLVFVYFNVLLFFTNCLKPILSKFYYYLQINIFFCRMIVCMHEFLHYNNILITKLVQ